MRKTAICWWMTCQKKEEGEVTECFSWYICPPVLHNAPLHSDQTHACTSHWHSNEKNKCQSHHRRYLLQTIRQKGVLSQNTLPSMNPITKFLPSLSAQSSSAGHHAMTQPTCNGYLDIKGIIWQDLHMRIHEYTENVQELILTVLKGKSDLSTWPPTHTSVTELGTSRSYTGWLFSTGRQNKFIKKSSAMQRV